MSSLFSKSSLEKPAATRPNDKESLSASLPSVSEAKDHRAYEHVRQKVKKAADTVRMRAQKRSPVTRPKAEERKAPRGKVGGLVSDDDDAFEVVLYDTINRDVPVERVTTPDIPRQDIRLSDLIIARKPVKRNDSDFEVIPHVRSVIVLDDVATRDVPVDEPWEHIYRDDNTPSAKIPTYATVLSSNK